MAHHINDSTFEATKQTKRQSASAPLLPPACFLPHLLCLCRHLPLAADLVKASRQQLVHRLDTYCKRHSKIFAEVGVTTPGAASALQQRMPA